MRVFGFRVYGCRVLGFIGFNYGFRVLGFLAFRVLGFKGGRAFRLITKNPEDLQAIRLCSHQPASLWRVWGFGFRGGILELRVGGLGLSLSPCHLLRALHRVPNEHLSWGGSSAVRGPEALKARLGWTRQACMVRDDR